MCARIVLTAKVASVRRDDEVSFSRYHQSRNHPRVVGFVLAAEMAFLLRDDEVSFSRYLRVLGNR